MRRIIALDIGTVRIGVAVSDPLGLFAQGLTVLQTKDDWKKDLADIVAKYQNPMLLVGRPKRTDGSDGPEVENIRRIVSEILEVIPGLEVEYWDERFTTTIAQQTLIEADVSRANRKKKVDMIAATLILQNYLDRKV